MSSPQHEIGKRLREIRLERNLSLKEVAEQTGISKGFLSLVETGKNDITVGRCMRLLHAYGLGLADLVQGGDADDPDVVRSNQRTHLRSPSEGVDIYLLTPDTHRKMCPYLVAFEPGGRIKEFAVHAGEEFVMILEGKVLMEMTGREPITLRKGDSAYYDSERGHTFTNLADGNALLLMASTPPHL
ncbi:MAG: cupin domain-containing protein [Dehalococcoidia bacterium]